MDEPMLAMEPTDLLCVLPIVKAELKKVLSFEGLHCLIPRASNAQQNVNMGESSPAPIIDLEQFNLSDRQKRRAEEAIRSSQPFWDAVGYHVFLPLNLTARTDCLDSQGVFTGELQAIVVITGINRLIHIEEAGRWLGVLSQYLHILIRNIFEQNLISRPALYEWNGSPILSHLGDVDAIGYPPFLSYYLQEMQGRSNGFAIVHLSQSRRLSEEAVSQMDDATTFCAKTKAICMRIWPSVRLKYLGGSNNEAWFSIFNKNPNQESQLKYDVLTSNLKRFWNIFPPGLARRFSIYLHFGKNSPPSLPYILQTEFLATQLGTRIFSSRDVALLQQKTRAFNIIEALQTITALNNSPKAVAFLSCGTDQNIDLHNQLTSHLPAHIQTIPAGESSVFIVSQNKSCESLRKSIEGTLKSLNKSRAVPPSFVMGIACEGKALKISLPNPTTAALYAHIHASLLPESEETSSENQGSLRLKTAIFDALTLHVAGDELFAMGDMEGACRMFKSALKMALKQERKQEHGVESGSSVVTPALLNSLGIAMLQTGRKAAAVRCFEQALGQFPEDIMAYYNLSGILLEMKQLDKMENLLRQAAQLAPKDIHVIIRLAGCLFEKGETNAALGLLAPFMTRNETELPATFFKLQGRLGLENGNWGYAKENLNKALVRTPYDAEILFFLAKGYLTIENDPKTARRLLNQAALLTGSKNLQKAIHDLQRRIETSR